MRRRDYIGPVMCALGAALHAGRARGRSREHHGQGADGGRRRALHSRRVHDADRRAPHRRPAELSLLRRDEKRSSLRTIASVRSGAVGFRATVCYRGQYVPNAKIDGGLMRIAVVLMRRRSERSPSRGSLRLRLAGRGRRAGSPTRRHPEGHDARCVLPVEARDQRRRLGDVLERDVPHRHVTGGKAPARLFIPDPAKSMYSGLNDAAGTPVLLQRPAEAHLQPGRIRARRAAKTITAGVAASSGVLSPAGPKAPPAKVDLHLPQGGHRSS